MGKRRKRRVTQNAEGEEELEEEPLEEVLEPFSKDQLTLLIKEAVAKHPDLMEAVSKLDKHPDLLEAADPVSEYNRMKIYVSNVPALFDMNKLLEFFSKFGEISVGPVSQFGYHKPTGKVKGFYWFAYKSVESAKKALKEPHKNLEGHILHCEKALDVQSHFNFLPGQPPQHQHLKHSESPFNQKYVPPDETPVVSVAGFVIGLSILVLRIVWLWWRG